MGSISQDRTFENEYHLPRGGNESLRLAAQHHMLQVRQGWTIRPVIAESLAKIPHPRIADVATGTGIWACEVAQQMPHAQVIGLDLSDQQFGPQWTLPSNLSLGLYDLLEDVPAELAGSFDFVHVRLLLCAGPAVDKSVFLDRFRCLLKPGGWLQWDDLAFPNVILCERSSKTPSGIQTWPMDDHPWMKVQADHLAIDKKASWFRDFEKAASITDGFQNASRLEVPLRPHLLQLETDLSLAVFTELGALLIQRKPELEAEVSKALKQFYDLPAQGYQFSYTWGVCIAQRSGL